MHVAVQTGIPNQTTTDLRIWRVHILHRPRSHINRLLAPCPTRNQAPIGLAARKYAPFLAQIDRPDHATFGLCGSSNWNTQSNHNRSAYMACTHILHRPRSHINRLLAPRPTRNQAPIGLAARKHVPFLAQIDRSPGPCYIRPVW